MAVFLDSLLLLTSQSSHLSASGGLAETITHWWSPKLDSENRANVAAAKQASYANSADAVEGGEQHATNCWVVFFSSHERSSRAWQTRGQQPAEEKTRPSLIAGASPPGNLCVLSLETSLIFAMKILCCHSRRAKLKEEPSLETGDLENFGKNDVLFHPRVPLPHGSLMDWRVISSSHNYTVEKNGAAL